MLKLEQIHLMRTSEIYRSSSIQDFFIQALQSPYKFFTDKRISEFFLKNINFQITTGEKVAVFGRNGSGKSTLCKLIAQQLFPSSGQINLSCKASLFSQLDSCFFKELSGHENLKFFIGWIYRHLSQKEQENLVRDCIEFSELSDKIDRLVYTYSLGMLSRLALCIITAAPHELLILDEVQTYADSYFRKKISGRMKNLVYSSQATLIISHYEDDLISMCERGIVIDQGQIIFEGPYAKALAIYKLQTTGTHA